MKSYKLKSGKFIESDALRQYEDSGLSESDISKEYGISRQSLYNIRKKLNCPVRFRSDKGVPRVDPEKKREGYNRYMRGYNRTNGINHPNTRIGKKTFRTSRLVAESDILGRSLEEGEVVHHIDGDTKNNDPKNLMIFASQSDHMKYHNGDEIVVLARYQGVCHFCGDIVTLANEGIKVKDKHNNVNYSCSRCCEYKGKEFDLMEEISKEKWKL